MHKRSLSLSLAAGAIAAVVAAAPAAAQERFTLTVLHHNDGESQLVNAGSGELEEFGGVARFETLVRERRRNALCGWRCGSIMVSSGDNFLAGPEFNASLDKGVPFYDALAMKRIGYDAITIGNHEFDFGPEILSGFIRGFPTRMPFVAANLDVSGAPGLARREEEGRIARSVVIRERGRRIGIIGATTPTLPLVSNPGPVEADDDVREAIQDEVTRLKDDGVDIIVASTHLQSIDEEVALVEELRGVDVVVAGGGGELLANEDDELAPGDEAQGPYPVVQEDSLGRDVPIVTTTGDYRYLGRLIVRFSESGLVTSIGRERSGPDVVGPDIEPDAEMTQAVVDPVRESIATLDETVIGSSEVPLDGTRDGVRTRETNLGSLATDSLLFAAQRGGTPADVALQNGGGIRNDSVFEAGELTELQTFDALPFSNFVAVAPDVPAQALKELLERGVSGVEEREGRFAQVGGMRFTYDPSQTAQELAEDGTVATPGQRVRELALDDGRVLVQNGQVVQGAPAVRVATIDFLARGGDGYPFGDLEFSSLDVTYQQALRDYIADGLGGQVTAAQYPEGGTGRITAAGG
ncbi:MAG: 5'-nucleotidase C-terminal domain-containing protein [Solirubrobacteraceae bacterium MAG38_C4-C5]|nr:5'-nucleotidase C-terminal domain-containing protein [Candidatus Siliceabacter maunaloa]